MKSKKKHVHLFDRESGNPVLDMINYVVKNHKGTPKTFTNKYGERKASSYKNQMVGQNASGFDNFILLNSLLKSYTSVKKIKN